MSDRDPLQNLWTAQNEEPFAMSIADIQVRAERFRARIRQRNWREIISAVFGVGVFGSVGWVADDLFVKAGAALIIVGFIFVSVQLSTRARAGDARDLARGDASLSFYRDALQRQYQALRNVGSWYLAPFVPGVTLFLAGFAFTPDSPAPLFAKVIIFAISMGICAAVFNFVYVMNQRAARELKAAINQLDSAD